jgi:outer membrane receptor protein involved in Fe transport
LPPFLNLIEENYSKQKKQFKPLNHFYMKPIVLIFSIFLSITASAQIPSNIVPKTGVINGTVVDNLSNTPLPYVNIIVKDALNNIITGGITNEQGEFTIKKIPEGESNVDIQFIGYKTVTKKITISRSNFKINLGTISLKEEVSELNEVVVVAETSTVIQKIDRKVINVGKDLTSTGTTASEMLNNVQSVSVDSQTGEISLRGNENVKVLVDGKPSNVSSAQILKQLPSTSIKSIELITNPSAKYNPEGMSGIINIVLHKNAALGFNATVNSGITRGENTRHNTSLNMNLKTGKVNFFANYGLNSGLSEMGGYVQRSDNKSLQEFFMENDLSSHLLKLGADVYLDEKNTFSLYTIQNKADNIGDVLTLVSFNDILNSRNTLLSERDSDSQTYNINYSLDFDKEGHNIEFEADFSSSDIPEMASQGETFRPDDLTSNYNELVDNDVKATLLNLDYTNPLSKSAKLELGVEFRSNETNNFNKSNQHEFVYEDDGNGNQVLIDDGNGWYETVPKGNSSFNYKRDIYSAYANYKQQFDKLTMQIGARIEQYDVAGDFVKDTENASYTNDVFSIYPSAFFTYSPSDKNQFQLSYSRRVDRPSIGQVNPIREWSTPLMTSVGNPNLKQQFTNSFELNYTRNHSKGSISFGTFYRRVNDNISRVLNIDPFNEDRVELSFSNTDSNNRYGFEISSSHKISNWWRTNSSFDLYVQDENGIANGQQLEVTNSSLNLRVSNSFTATKNLRFQLFGMYRGGAKSIQLSSDPMWMINTGASLSILQGKGSISFRVNDIFEGMKSKFKSTNPYPANGQFNWESRTAYLGFMYRFGSGKNKAKTRKTRDSNETQGSGGFL